MKKYSSFNLSSLISFICLPVLIYSCCAVAKSESPLTYGYGAYIAPGLQLGESKTSIHAVAGYERIKLNGGGGHNNFLQFGAQIRQSLSADPDHGFWIGGEATYLSIKNKYDNSSVKPTASGMTIGALGGYRFKIGTLPLSFYAAPAFLSRGKFKTNGMSSGTTGSGFLGRVGFDIHFASLLGKKGR